MMMEENIFKQIEKEIREFNTQSIQIVDKFKFNQKKTIEQIYRYYNSVFESGEYDSEGFKKYFFNICRNPCYIATKAIDFDTKDIILVPAPGQNEMIVWLMDRELKYWMKEKKFGLLLNRIFYELPIFGTVVLKKVKNQLYFVDLRNLVNEQSADSLRESSYVIELHYYTPQELRKQKWDNIEETIKLWRQTKVPYIRIIERYGEVPESWLRENGDPNKYVYARFICYSREAKPQEIKKHEISTYGYILDKAEITPEDFPYREIHWEKIPGRWLGIGRVEVLFDPQIRINELMNLRVKSSYFASLNIFQTSDETINKNLLTDVKNGQVIITRTGITRVPTEERNLAAFENEQTRWLQNRDELTMSYDVIRGERLPAGTPLGAAVLAATMTTSYFDQIRENVALEIKNLLYQDVIPAFIEETSKEHYLKLVGEDFEAWNKLKIVLELNREVLNFVLENEKMPSPLQYELMKEHIIEKRRKMKSEEVFIPKDLYKDVKYKIDIVITGEARDIRTRAANLQMALQAITADPTLLHDPVRRKIFLQILHLGGIHLTDIENVETQPEGGLVQKIEKKVGGGITKPVLPSTPIIEPTETKI